jgi:riboflavin synthase
MFTGLVSDIGEVAAVAEGRGLKLTIATHYDVDAIHIGGSVAVAGACLTVVDKGQNGGVWFAVEASKETQRATTIGAWRVGTKVNLERPLKVGEELGGHIVTGHVDGVGTLARIAPENGSLRMSFAVPEALARYIAPKGSIAVDGVSLTVNAVDRAQFDVNIIPHTCAVTTLGALKAGDAVNVEVDILARYIARLAVRD